ncbi:hypothetical protein HEP87_60840 [Streptomyces sp. S1D4-11]
MDRGLSDPLIPRAARDTQPEPRPGFPRPGDRDRPDDSRAHVRLTLLDDVPVPDVPARIALQVVPGPGHPWSTAPLPPLTARAASLGHAEIDPRTASPPTGRSSASPRTAPARTGCASPSRTLPPGPSSSRSRP